jgi:hypothetical protein
MMRRPVWFTASPSVWAARLLAGGMPVAFVGLLHLLAPAAEWMLWPWALVAVLCLRRPDSDLPLAGWIGLWGTWVVLVPDQLAWSMAAAGLTLLGHVGCAVLAGAPRDLHVPARLAGRWAGRIGVVLGLTAAVAAVADRAAYLRLGERPGSVAMVVALLVGVGVWAWLTARVGAGPADPPG